MRKWPLQKAGGWGAGTSCGLMVEPGSGRGPKPPHASLGAAERADVREEAPLPHRVPEATLQPTAKKVAALSPRLPAAAPSRPHGPERVSLPRPVREPGSERDREEPRLLVEDKPAPATGCGGPQEAPKPPCSQPTNGAWKSSPRALPTVCGERPCV